MLIKYGLKTPGTPVREPPSPPSHPRENHASPLHVYKTLFLQPNQLIFPMCFTLEEP
jgi:hypothetical protein